MNRKGFISKPIDIAAGFILAILAVVILVTVYAVANSINIDDTLVLLDNRLALHEYTAYTYDNLTIADYIIYQPVLEDLDNAENITGFPLPPNVTRILHKDTGIIPGFYPGGNALNGQLYEATKEYFTPFGDKWMIIIDYPKSYGIKDIIINKHSLKQSVGKTYLPLPRGGYATVELFYVLDVLFVPFGMGYMPVVI